MEVMPSPRVGFLGWVFLANHLARQVKWSSFDIMTSNDNLTRTNKTVILLQQWMIAVVRIRWREFKHATTLQFTSIITSLL